MVVVVAALIDQTDLCPSPPLSLSHLHVSPRPHRTQQEPRLAHHVQQGGHPPVQSGVPPTQEDQGAVLGRFLGSRHRRFKVGGPRGRHDGRHGRRRARIHGGRVHVPFARPQPRRGRHRHVGGGARVGQHGQRHVGRGGRGGGGGGERRAGRDERRGRGPRPVPHRHPVPRVQQAGRHGGAHDTGAQKGDAGARGEGGAGRGGGRVGADADGAGAAARTGVGAAKRGGGAGGEHHDWERWARGMLECGG